MFFLNLLFSSLPAQEIRIELNNPVYKSGSLSTNEGGIIETDTMRIQARSISYTEKENNHLLLAEGNLLITLEDRFFIGERFTYNFLTKEGELTNGITRLDNLFIDGKKVLFHPDGTLSMASTLVTTSEESPPTWTIHAENTTIDQKTEVKAKNLTLSVYERPVFWLPQYSRVTNEKFIQEPASDYRILWESKQGPLLLFRQRLFENEYANLYWRLEHRLKHGIKGAGTALEFNYNSPDKAHTLETRNFYAYDTYYQSTKQEDFHHRYRIQGIYGAKSKDTKIETFARWDVLSDSYLRSDFPTQLFELSTLERTEAFVKTRYEPLFTSFYVRPRVNSFTGFKQELPTCTLASKPFLIGETGIIWENYAKLSYLDYVYAKELSSFVKDFHSSRLETRQTLYRPSLFGPVEVTPHITSNLIYYGNTPEDKPFFQTITMYGVKSGLSLYKEYPNGTHQIKPYAEYLGMVGKENRHYIFGIDDGFHPHQRVKIGLFTEFLSFNSLFPSTSLDLFTYHFFANELFPKTYIDLSFEYPYANLTTSVAWNSEKKRLDHFNLCYGLTYSETVAFSVEFRHRSAYEWRKNSFSNYILDLTHSEEELRHSPLSDARQSLVAKCEIQFPPFWTVDLYHHLGWRPHESFYHELKIDIYTIFSNAWRLRLSYTRTVDDDAFSFGINLL